MRWQHWLLAAAAVAILIAEQLLTGSPNQPGRYLIYYYALEVAYFFVLLALGTAIGGVVRKRLLARQDKAEYLRSVGIYRLLALIFVIAAGMYLMTAWIPGWIGRHIIFFGGYYYGLSRIDRRDE
ncbi:hypothetical protein [Effusibacillus pohliae]|uniref:hypothetical protein n=1 Tax=Effusibacillus pohliae TaxID=232270 RepID=UPI00037BA6EA|nr:hypothetical protein [Effusibacillus pohliae]